MPSRVARAMGGVGLSGASVAGAGAAGVVMSMRAAYPLPPDHAPSNLAPISEMPDGRLAVAVVLGASGSVITDAFGPYEVFALSPAFFVYSIGAGPIAMLSGALAVGAAIGVGLLPGAAARRDQR